MPDTQNITIYNEVENATFAAAGSPTNTTVDGYVF
jgi:hypothetical protein